MTYIVIDDDERATLTVHPAAPNIAAVEGHLRDMGWNKVYPPPATGLVGWVSDVGHCMPEFSRNIIGSLVMAGLGSGPYPLAGPLVITGYLFDEGGWPEPLDDRQTRVAVALYLAVLDALGMPAPDGLGQYREGSFHGPEFAAIWRDMARELRSAPTPSLTLITPDLP